MKVAHLILVTMLFVLFGCSDEGLTGALSEKDAFETETAAMAGLLDDSLATDRGMALFVSTFTFEAEPDADLIDCADANGTPFPELPTLFAEADLMGRSYYLGDMTGRLVNEQCSAVLNDAGVADHIEATGTLKLTGENGDALSGTYTATIMPDSTVTFDVSITDGVRRFAGATGWIRGIGTFDPTAESGTFYGKGVVSPPTDVDDVQFQGSFTFEADTTATPLSCVDAAGNAVPDLLVPSTLEATGVAVNLGPTTGFIDLDACLVNADGSVAGPGTFGFVSAEGDSLTGTFAARFQPDSTASAEAVITNGTGAFAGATGWFTTTGTTDLTEGSGTFDLEGWIYPPR